MTAVDDCLCGSSVLGWAKELQSQLHAKRPSTPPTLATTFLNINIRRDDKGGYHLGGQQYIHSPLTKLAIPKIPYYQYQQLPKSASWSHELDSTTAAELVALRSAFGFDYREVCGSLVYILNFRPDCRFSISLLASHGEHPSETLYKELPHFVTSALKFSALILMLAILVSCLICRLNSVLGHKLWLNMVFTPEGCYMLFRMNIFMQRSTAP